MNDVASLVTPLGNRLSWNGACLTTLPKLFKKDDLQAHYFRDDSADEKAIVNRLRFSIIM